MKSFAPLPKLQVGDKVAILSPSFAAPAKWPHVHELGLKRLREEFGLEPVEFPTTRQLGASGEERARDLIAAFEDLDIKAVIATLGGNDQVTYVKNLPPEPFARNPKPFFGYSDNSHIENFLWLQGIPSYYGGSIFTQFAMQKRMDPYTVNLLKTAFFETGEYALTPSPTYNDQGLDWSDPATLNNERLYEMSEGWEWEGVSSAEGVTWGGCLESIDEMLRHGATLPSLEEFENIILFTETSEEIPSHEYVARVFRALGERGILARAKGFLIGRPKAWEFNKQHTAEEKMTYRAEQRAATLAMLRRYNTTAPIVQNMEIGHTDPQIPLPYGSRVRIDTVKKQVWATF